MNKLRENRYDTRNVPYNKVNFTDADELLQFYKDERRRELCFEGHRWFDLRRYGCPELKHVWYDESGEAIEYTLREKDPGYTLLIPQEAFTQNPSLVQNETRNE